MSFSEKKIFCAQIIDGSRMSCHYFARKVNLRVLISSVKRPVRTIAELVSGSVIAGGERRWTRNSSLSSCCLH